MKEFNIADLLPMLPWEGPPLPAFLSIYWPWRRPKLPEPPEKGVVVGILNPPNGATMWSLTLTDQDMTVAIHEASGKDRLDIAEAATFEIPNGVKFPLRIVALQITKWNEAKTALIQLYYAQSMHPNQYDWNTGTYTGPPDPNYREAFIPGYGSYYYNVTTDRFEKV